MKFNAVTAEDWWKSVGKTVPAVVVLRTTVPRAFDTDSPCVGFATGFVVDKSRGFILTNRHVVRPGPVVAEAMFSNGNEVPVHPIYKDPVHDFGFFRYDPSRIQFLNYEEIPLVPEAACVGLEIRVVGSDSGENEKVSILPGTIVRLDSDAPQYKKDGYNDFNTFYIQATSRTKVGSSGSPVIDWQGRAVALHAGSNVSSTLSYFLPLERVVRALRFLQKGDTTYVGKWKEVSIPRGTLQVIFLHKGFYETHRLGLRSETEQTVRQTSSANETGMLVVESVVPGGPVDKHLEPGDVLVRVNGQVTTQFLKLETILDDNVNSNIELQIERGGSSKSLTILVQDLHSITPNYFLEVSGAVIHPLSYMQARNFRFHCGLVYVAEPGYMFFKAGVPRHAIIKKFAGEEISCLWKLISVLSKLSWGAQVPLEYISYVDIHRRKLVLVTVDRHEWYAPPQIYTRDDSTGLWNAIPAFQPDVGNLASYPISLTGEHACRRDVSEGNHQELADGVTSMETNSEDPSKCVSHGNGSDGIVIKRRRVDDLSTDGSVADISAATANPLVTEHVVKSSLVMLEVQVPPSFMLDDVLSRRSIGTGVIIYCAQDMGLVAVDKNTVAVLSSEVMLTFAAFPVQIPGQVVFLHPVQNFALVSYNPSALGSAGASVVRAAVLLPEPALYRGDSVYLVGLTRSLQAISKKLVVTDSRNALTIASLGFPHYRATNMEVIDLNTVIGNSFSGVLTDEQGRVQALWGVFSTQKKINGITSGFSQFSKGIPIYAISQVLDKIISGANGPHLLINGVKRPMPQVRILEVEFTPRLLSMARSLGLSDFRIKALVNKDPLRQQLLHVEGCWAGSKAENHLEQGDMVVAINNEPVTCFRDIENACQALDQSNTNDGKLQMTVLRQGREIELLVGTDVRDGNGTTRAVSWCGCIVQDTHLAARALGFLPEEGRGVYVARCNHGCPAYKFGLLAIKWIVEINGKPTPDLDTFVDVTKELEHEEFVRVKTIQLNGNPQVIGVKQDLHYWPTWELRFNPDNSTWHRT
ncbi:Protease Do-like 7 [Trifolium repens]|nr:Protease Do-like 7 [Trifolium repens]